MGILFSAKEIFDIAIQIEKNGAALYRRAAGVAADAGARQELNGLAAMEDRHVVTFTDLKASLIDEAEESAWFDPENEAARYLEAFAQGQVFDLLGSPPESLFRNAVLKDILLYAVGRERDSIVFYLGMKELAPAGLGREKVDRIIKEEMAHVAMLNRRLTQLGAG